MRRLGSGRTRTAAVLLGVVLASGACTGDEPARDKPEKPADKAVAEVQLRSSVGVVTGKLKPAQRTATAGRVGQIVDAWFDAAYLAGGYPRTSFRNSFPGFTSGAAALARRDQRFLTNAAFGPRIDGVVAVRKTVKVDVLGAKRRAAGATARFRLEFLTTGDLERRVVVSGRLMLAPVKGAWKVFAYDVQRSVGAAEGGAR